MKTFREGRIRTAEPVDGPASSARP
jgi:hypothetical protein